MRSLVCSTCGGPKAKLTQWRCRSCHAAWMREWRKTHPMTLEQKAKDCCRSIASVYKARGKLHPQPCAVCGSTEKLEMHHEDYRKPLDVIWLCRPHHCVLTIEEQYVVQEKQSA